MPVDLTLPCAAALLPVIVALLLARAAVRHAARPAAKPAVRRRREAVLGLGLGIAACIAAPVTSKIIDPPGEWSFRSLALLLVMMVPTALFVASLLMVAFRSFPDGRTCRRCGYDLTVQTGSQCPECGIIGPRQQPRARARYGGRLRRAPGPTDET